MLSHIFLAFFERIHGKIYMRKIKKKGVNVDESNRFEQLSLFELCMGDDESSGGSETSEGEKQSIIYHFEGEESRAVEQSGISTLSGDQFTLRTGVEYVPSSGISKYCPACAKRIQREKSNESKRRSRERNRRACIELSAKNDRLILNSRMDEHSGREICITKSTNSAMLQKNHLMHIHGRWSKQNQAM